MVSEKRTYQYFVSALPLQNCRNMKTFKELVLLVSAEKNVTTMTNSDECATHACCANLAFNDRFWICFRQHPQETVLKNHDLKTNPG